MDCYVEHIRCFSNITKPHTHKDFIYSFILCPLITFEQMDQGHLSFSIFPKDTSYM